MSPGFTYPLTNRGQNSGAGLATVLDVICRYGIATWADMPEGGTWWEYPADEIWAKALPFRGERVIGFSTATAAGLQAVKTHLAGGDLAVFVVPVSANFRNYPHGDGVDNDVLYENGEIDDYHAVSRRPRCWPIGSPIAANPTPRPAPPGNSRPLAPARTCCCNGSRLWTPRPGISTLPMKSGWGAAQAAQMSSRRSASAPCCRWTRWPGHRARASRSPCDLAMPPAPADCGRVEL